MTAYRFERTFEPRGTKNYSSTYYVYREDESLRCLCDVYGMCIKGPTRFLPNREAAHAEFIMEAKGKFMNTTYYLQEGDGRPIFGTIKRPRAGHGGTLLERFLITGLLYGLPMAVIFARRDWEHAVGAHYMINMMPTLMVFLET